MSNEFARSAYPEAPVYLFYGNKVGDILRARDTVLGSLLDPETRDESLTEYRTTGRPSYGVELFKLLPEIAGDLATLSFLPGSHKAAVVVNPMELYGSASASKGAKRTAKKKAAAIDQADGDEADGSDEAMRWLAEVLPRTGNYLLLLAFEDEAEGREVNEKLPLFQEIAKLGHTQRFRDTKAFFKIEDMLLRRDAMGCLKAVRDLWGGDKGEAAAYGAIARTMRFMLQANIAVERDLARDPVKLERCFPARAQFNLFKSADFVRKKYARGMVPYRTAPLLKAYERLLEVYRAMRPSRDQLYVPDQLELLERVLMELFASPPPAQSR